MPSSRLAAVDIGSNTVHALVADVDDHGDLYEVGHHLEMPELGARVDSDRPHRSGRDRGGPGGPGLA